MEKTLEQEINELISFCKENEEKIDNFDKRISKIERDLEESPAFAPRFNIEKELVLMRNEAMYGIGEEKLEKLSIN